jgi:hypothetical protein
MTNAHDVDNFTNIDFLTNVLHDCNFDVDFCKNNMSLFATKYYDDYNIIIMHNFENDDMCVYKQLHSKNQMILLQYFNCFYDCNIDCDNIFDNDICFDCLQQNIDYLHTL